VQPRTNSGDLGTGATCHEVVGNVTNVTCGNFVAPRTFTVNGLELNCGAIGGGTYQLPPQRAGGFCMQVGAGQYPYAYFTTF
jgi:hypothetical protein